MANESVSKVSRPNGYGISRNTEFDELEGHVVTRWGYVIVWSDATSASLRIVHDGYQVFRTLRQGYTRRGLAAVASRFAEEICG